MVVVVVVVFISVLPRVSFAKTHSQSTSSSHFLKKLRGFFAKLAKIDVCWQRTIARCPDMYVYTVYTFIYIPRRPKQLENCATF